MYKKRKKIHLVIQVMKKDLQKLPSATRRAEMALSTWYLWEKLNPHLLKLRKGAERICKAMRNAAVEDANFKAAISGNVAAQCFYLKNEAGWKDNALIDQSQHINITYVRERINSENSVSPAEISGRNRILPSSVQSSDNGQKSGKNGDGA